MDAVPSVPELVERWRAGDEDAARLLFEQYSTRLTALAERQLSQKLAGRTEGMDIVQSAFRTFFMRSARGEFRIEQSIDIWRLLVKLTLAKARSQARRHTAERRDVHSEVGGGDDWFAEMAARVPQPAEAIAVVDEIDRVLSGLPEAYGDILALRLEGISRTEIASRLHVSRQTVYRALALIRERLERLRPD